MHPLQHVLGPLLGRMSPLFIYTMSYLGIKGRVLRHSHRVYETKVLRISPNSVSVSDSTAVHAIYVAGGGFHKNSRYVNFNLGDVVTIFSAIDTKYRDTRTKAVAPLFAPGRLHVACEPQGVIYQCGSEFVDQLKAFREEYKSRRVGFDILDLCVPLSLDVVTGYLLNERYGGLTEHQHLPMETRRIAKLSINPFIFATVGFSRFSLLPNELFRFLYSISSRISFSEAIGRCFVSMDTFAQRLVRQGGAFPSNS